MKFTLAGEKYTTKKSVLDRCRRMLHGHEQTNDTFLFDLLSMHSEAEQKIGCGVARFFTDDDGYGGRCFWLERLDGSRTDWSFIACLTPPTHKQEVCSAMRRLIEDQIIAFRNRTFSGANVPVCAITGCPVWIGSAHVDHRPPDTFVSLVERFLAERRCSYADISVKPTEDGSTTTELVDSDVSVAWREFHRLHSSLQITSAKANLSQGRGPKEST